jgi:hypothetical protein
MVGPETDGSHPQGELRARRSALRNALIEFVAVFVSELCWNFFRKTGGSTFDFFGIAAVTAILLYFFERERGA